MKLYELYAILSPNLSEAETNSLLAKITDELAKEGFGITSSQIKQNERLTHKMGKFRQSHTLNIEISGPEDKVFPQEIYTTLLHNSDVLRHFVYAKSEKMLKKAKPFPNFDQFRSARPERKFPVVIEHSPITEPKPETQKVDIEEVDKKLEELLK